MYALLSENETMKTGQLVKTSFGEGNVLHYRELDGIIVIELPFGVLYHAADAMRGDDQADLLKANRRVSSEELNVMYESLEKMRKLNLEVACEEKGVQFSEDSLTRCTACLLQQKAPSTVSENIHQSRFPRLRRFVDQQSKTIHGVTQSLRKPKACLICGSLTCVAHSSECFRKEDIVVCTECERMFETEYIVECLTAPSPDERRFLTDGMLTIYERTLLLLKYSCQFIGPVAESLERMTEKSNRVSVGSSGAGVVSGMLGMCAAATILTPMGPPLLVASLLFGGSATAVQTGSELRNYYSEPNQLADRIIALHGMIYSILDVTRTLQDVIMRDNMDPDLYEEHPDYLFSGPYQEDEKRIETRTMLGMTVGRAAAASVELGTLAGTGATGASLSVAAETASVNAGIFNRSGMALLRSARVARFAGGALSAATVALEAKSLTTTLTQIRAGNPCEKAITLREISKETNELPTTEEVTKAIERFLGIMALRRRNMSEEEARAALLSLKALADSNENTLHFVTEEEESGEPRSDAVVNEYVSSSAHQRNDYSITVEPSSRAYDSSLSEFVTEDQAGNFVLRPVQKTWAFTKSAVSIASSGVTSSLRSGMDIFVSRNIDDDPPVPEVCNTGTTGSRGMCSAPSFDENLTA